MNDAGGATLQRTLRLGDAVGIGFGAIVGAGIFVVTGVAAGLAGPALLVGLALAGIAATANALSSAQLAAYIPKSGGTYEYANQLIDPHIGFVAGWMFLASKIAAAGTVALGLGGYLDPLLPGVRPRVLAVAAIVVFTLLNYFGVRRSSRVNLLIVAVSVGSLLVFVATGAPAADPANFTPFAPAGVRGTLQAAALLFFAYTGYARIATLGEEVVEPARTIPRAVLITIAGALLLYAAVAAVAIGLVGAAPLGETAAPLYVAAAAADLPTTATLVAVGGVAAMLGVILSQLLGLSRMAFAMARRGDLPLFLAHIELAHGTPDRAVLIIGAIAAIVAATGTLAGVAAAAAFTILIYYAIANVSALRMPAEARLFGDYVPVTGLIGCAVLAVSLDVATIATGLAVLAAGFLLRAGYRRTRR